jgi:hypothetical protein
VIRLVVRRRAEPQPAEQLLEIVSPRTNSALISAAEHLCGALTLQTRAPAGGPLALEIIADRARRWFLIRTQSIPQQRQLRGQIGAAYPQATLSPLGPALLPTGDPARVGTDEQVAACTMGLRAGDHLPLRTFLDRDLDSDQGPAQTDPILGVLGALDDLPPGWRALSQLVLFEPAPANWARAYQRLALEHPIMAERSGRGESGTSLSSLLFLVGLGILAAVGFGLYDSWNRGDWEMVSASIAGSVAAIGLGVGLYLRFGRRELYDPKLVQDKLSRDACRAELRLAVIAPCHVETAVVQARLDRIVAAYRPFALETGNSLVSRPIRSDVPDLRLLQPFGRRCLLNARELAGLWHLPQAADDVPLVERTTARRRLPLPATVAVGPRGEGCRIGLSEHQGHEIPVVLPPGLLQRHLLAIAKTRRGKSSLMLQLVHHLMLAGSTEPAAGGADCEPQCIILVDPHRDLATAALGLVPRERESDVVYLDLGNRSRPFGINLLDVGLGWDRDQAVGNTLRVFKREFDAFWGPRMEDAFRFALMALFEANEAHCRADPVHGRAAQHTILEVPDLLENAKFRHTVLKRVSDRAIGHWFSSYFQPLELHHRQEIINPVQTKVHKYVGSKIARGIVGQPRSTLDFREMIARGKIVLVNLNAFDVGEDTAALLGGTLLNLAARAVSAQSALVPEERRRVTIAVDEFHTIPGADYEQVFGELAKYGANMILATQTLARLDHLSEAERTRDLRGVVFANLDGLFAFHTSAEDAHFLAPELGGELMDQDLLELGHYQCYARLTDVRTGERLPAFTVRLDPPPAGDATIAARLADDSAERYGRDALDVDLDLQGAWERVHGPGPAGNTASYPETDQPGAEGGGGAALDRTVSGSQLPAPRPVARGKKASRNRSRPTPGRAVTDLGDGSAAA